MKQIITLCFLFIIIFKAEARQLRSVINGNWEDSLTWNIHAVPDSMNDTIIIETHVSVNSTITLSNNNLLIVDSGSSLCGNDSFFMTHNAMLFNYGFIGFNYWYSGNADIPWSAYNTGWNAYIDIGDGGMYINASGFKDTLGCLLVHEGPQQCILRCKLDSLVKVSMDSNAVTITPPDVGFEYQYNFGDGFATSYDGLNAYTHTYSDSGNYTLMIAATLCCNVDTLYTAVHIAYQEPAPCIDKFPLTVLSNPSSNSFMLTKQFCFDTQIKLRLFSLSGQLIFSTYFNTTNAIMNETISTEGLAAACYVAEIDVGRESFKRKIVVIH